MKHLVGVAVEFVDELPEGCLAWSWRRKMRGGRIRDGTSLLEVKRRRRRRSRGEWKRHFDIVGRHIADIVVRRTLDFVTVTFLEHGR